MLLTIDLGNSSTGIAIFADDRIISRNKLITPAEVTIKFIKSLIKESYRKEINKVIVSSVVPFVDDSLDFSIREMFSIQPVFVDHKTETGVTLKVDRPEEVGADRIADILGAFEFTGSPFIVIDSGTATTFDIVTAQNEYIGGAIFPGIELSINSLAKNTAKLKRIKFYRPESIIGSNTDDCIRSGIFNNHIGGVKYMIEEYKKVLPGDSTVIATGGLAMYFKDIIESIDIYEPDLIFFGLKKIYDHIS